MATYTSPKIAELEKKLKREPYSLVFVQLAEEYRRVGEFDNAVRICRDGLQKHPNHVSANMLLGRIYFENRQYKEARAELQKVISASPENLMAHRLLGDICWFEEDLEPAEKEYRMVYMLNPTDQEVRQRLTVIEGRLRAKALEDAARARAASTASIGVAEGEHVPIPGVDEPLIDIQSYGEPAGAEEAAREEDKRPAEAVGFAEAAGEPARGWTAPPSVGVPPAPEHPGLEASGAAAAAESMAELKPTVTPVEEAPSGFYAIGVGGEAKAEAMPTSFPVTPPSMPETPVSEQTVRFEVGMFAIPEPSVPRGIEAVEERGPEPAPAAAEVSEELATATLAELYAAQGHHGKAAAVYRRLLERNPSDDALWQKLWDAERLASQPVEPASQVTGVPLELTSERKVAILQSWLAAMRVNRMGARI
ncbi:MAG: tetratricopeptide repeat protein [Acidobacteriota bacterium]